MTIAFSTFLNWRARHHICSCENVNFFGGKISFPRLSCLSKHSELDLLDKENLSNNVHDETLIDNAHRKAQEYDQDWYAMVMSDILGVDESIDDKKKASCEVESLYEESEAEEIVVFDPGLNPSLARPNKKFMPSANSMKGAVSSSKRYNASRTEGRHGVDNGPEENCDESFGTSTHSSSKNNNRTPLVAMNNAKRITMLRYMNQHGRQKEINTDVLWDLGYRLSDINKLRGSAVEMIVKSGLQRPKGGIPKTWTVLSKSPEVDFIWKSTTLKRGGGYESKRSRSQFSETLASNFSGGERGTEISDREREKVGGSKRRSSDSFYTANREDFWMDVGTFTSFLRKEAQFRLSILGPSWSNAVKGESRWRLEIYKNWLAMINDIKREKRIRSKYRSRGATAKMKTVQSKRMGRQRKKAR